MIVTPSPRNSIRTAPQCSWWNASAPIARTPRSRSARRSSETPNGGRERTTARGATSARKSAVPERSRECQPATITSARRSVSFSMSQRSVENPASDISSTRSPAASMRQTSALSSACVRAISGGGKSTFSVAFSPRKIHRHAGSSGGRFLQQRAVRGCRGATANERCRRSYPQSSAGGNHRARARHRRRVRCLRA